MRMQSASPNDRFFRFRRPVVLERLQGRNFADPRWLSDEQLLQFLGANAEE
jgi:hypothetical protein